jgi:pyruvate,water dikinase
VVENQDDFELHPVPQDFPFEWEHPDEAKLSWVNDRLHFAGQYSPLASWYIRHHFAPGMASGRTATGRPSEMRMRRVNTYLYSSRDRLVRDESIPEPPPPTENEQDEAIRQFGDRWESEWLPEIKANHKMWGEFDLEGATVQEMLAHLEWSLNTVKRHYTIHGQLLSPGMLAAKLLEELYSELYEDAGTLDVYQLTQGFENSSTLMGWDLYDLSRSAAGSAEVLSILDQSPTDTVLDRLDEFEPGIQFAQKLRSFLELWGNRAESTLEIGDPTWSEDPSPVIQNIMTYAASENEHPRDRWNALVAERESRVNEVREFLALYPEQIKTKFEELLIASQKHNQVQEDHNWWIDQLTPANVRHVFMEFGRRMSAGGTIEKPEDVFMLEGAEVIAAATSEFTVDWKSVVSDRVEEMKRWENYDPPIKLGRISAAAPDSAQSRALNSFFGAISPDELVDRPGLMTGSPASKGKIVGTARVITRLADAGRLLPGDILVTVSTLPPWTPLFATAGGVVTDAGGSLSHAAIVAREYGIPAVVGTVFGTTTIKDGHQIEVDGDDGTVRILDE